MAVVFHQKRLNLSFASVVIIIFLITTGAQETSYHGPGFIVYCPCMGRFGNQAEQLLGSLYFAKLLNRTLVLPPFTHYGENYVPELVRFDYIIQVEPIKQYHEVITLHDFLDKYSDSIWSEDKRKFYCHSPKIVESSKPPTCNAMKGQPFKAFWSRLNMTDKGAVSYQPLNLKPSMAKYWREMFPVPNHPVLTFVGAPSSYPTCKESIAIQKYIEISHNIKEEALKFKRKHNFFNEPYISMHIRHGPDWRKACDLLQSEPSGLKQLFSSNQCTGYPSPWSELEQVINFETCLPPHRAISEKLNHTIERFREATKIDLKIIHIATDYDDDELWGQLQLSLPSMRFIKSLPHQNTLTSTMIDIYLMTNADIFIGNCISSFSAFPARIRSEQMGLRNQTLYFGQEFLNKPNYSSHDEL